MMNKILLSLLAILALNTFTACNKYEDGPMLSFRSRTSRVANDWAVKTVYVNGKNDASNAELGNIYSFAKDGRFTYMSTTTGSWRLINSDEVIYLEFDKDSSTAEYSITKLKEKELWMHYYNTSNDKVQLRME